MPSRWLIVMAAASMLTGCAANGNDTQRPAEPARSTTVPTAAAPEPAYFGQPVPGATPQRFAPGIVSTDAIELDSVFSPDGREFYFTRIVDGLDTLHQMVRVGETWGQPRELLLFPDHTRVESDDMVLSSDGQEMYFLARYDHAGTGPKPNYDIWVSHRVNGEWATATLVGPRVSTAADELYPVLDADGNLYFNSNRDGSFKIYRARRRSDGSFDTPVRFGPPTDGEHGAGDMSLAADGSYMVMSVDRPDGFGHGDLHVSFRRADGSWTDLVRLDSTINTPDHEWCPMLTRDGKYLFFSRLKGEAGPPWKPGTVGDVYWVDARILERYRPADAPRR